MRTRVTRWGNSLGVRIPKPLAASRRLVAGSEVEITDDGDGLRLVPVVPRYRLEDLLAKITPKNLHVEVPTGAARGKESW